MHRLQIRPVVCNWGHPLQVPKLHPGSCNSVGRGQTDTQTRLTTIHFASSMTHAKCNKRGTLNAVRCTLSCVTDSAVRSDELPLDTVLEKCVEACLTLLPSVPNILVTLGRHGVVLARRGHTDSAFPTRSRFPAVIIPPTDLY